MKEKAIREQELGNQFSGASWREMKVGEIAEINPRPALGPDGQLLASFVPMKSVEEESGRFFPEGNRRAVELLGRYVPFRDGDVLLAKVTPCMENGKAAVMTGLTNGLGFGSTEFFVLRPSPQIDARYLLHFLLQRSFRERAAQNMTGAVGLRRVPRTYLEAQTIPVPPIAIQRQLVGEIEKHLVRLDVGRQALSRAEASLSKYVVSTMAAACQGRLLVDTGQRRDREDSSDGLAIAELKERSGIAYGDRTRRRDVEQSIRQLPCLPEGWHWRRFGDLGEDPGRCVQTGPFGAQLHNTDFRESGVPVIAVGNLTGTGFTRDGLYFVDSGKAEQLSRYDVSAGDLLFARSGATLGKVCVAPDYVRDWRMTGHILRARLNRKLIKPEFAVYALAGLPAVRAQVFGNVRGVTRPGFNTGLLESILIPVPPMQEQQRILAEAQRRLSIVDELNATIAASLQRAMGVREAILQKAFAGQLL